MTEARSASQWMRNVLLAGILSLLVLFALYYSRPFLLPIILALLLSFLLNPVVVRLRKIGIPHSIGAGLVVIALLASAGYGVYALSGPAAQWIAAAPQTVRQLEVRPHFLRRPVQEVSKATEQVERLATDTLGENTPEVEVKEASLLDTILSRTKEILTGTVVTVALLYFFLASGDIFLRKLVKVLPRLQDQKRAVTIARELQDSLSTYFAAVTLINIGVGLATGAIAYFLGMPNAPLWGIRAGLFNFIPYFGVMVNLVILSGAAILAFEEVGRAMLVPPAYLIIHLVEANLVTPKVVGRRLTLNPAAVFIGITFWWWIWGIPGALVATPILKTTKIICDHIAPLSAIGEFLGD